MQAKQRLKRILTWERSILLLSFWLAVAFFAVALLWGNAAHLIQGVEGGVGLQDAGLWFVRAFMLSVLFGTAVNVVGHLILIAVDAARRLRS